MAGSTVPVPLMGLTKGLTSGSSFYLAIDGIFWNSGMAGGTEQLKNYINATDLSEFPHTLLFKSTIWDNQPQNITAAYYTVTQMYVESAIFFSASSSGSQYRVTDMRQSKLP